MIEEVVEEGIELDGLALDTMDDELGVGAIDELGAIELVGLGTT